MSAAPAASPPIIPRFVHLRLHSEYSITDGIARLDDVIARARADGMPALALTDLANLFGMVKFYTEARSHGVKPIVGCDVWIADADEGPRGNGGRLLLLVRNHAGYLRLSELLPEASLTGRNRDRVELPRAAWPAATTSGRATGSTRSRRRASTP